MIREKAVFTSSTAFFWGKRSFLGVEFIGKRSKLRGEFIGKRS
jgi:hypothetical protein